MQKKRRKLRLISLLCGAAMLAGLINPAMFGGGASEVEAADAIEISTPEELQKIGKDAAYPLSGDYVLKNDLDMAGSVFTPIGGIEGEKGTVSGDNVFSGTFDGQGHLISNLTMEVKEDFTGKTNYAQIGLFSVVASASEADYASVKNLVFANVDITVDITGGLAAAGTLAGEVNGYAAIENIAVLDGSIKVNGSNQCDTVGAGGLIGECRTSASMGNNFITVKNIYNGAEILAGSSTANEFSGGIIGRVSISNCKEISGCVNVGYTSFRGELGYAIAPFANGADNSCVKNSYFLFATGEPSGSGTVEVSEDELKSGVLPENLDAEVWYASTDSYPLLQICKNEGPSGYLGLLALAPEFAKNENANSVTKDFTLPDSVGDVKVTWTSSNPDVIAVEGTTAKVKGVLSPVKVVLTASTEDGKTRKYTITVVSNITAEFDQNYAKAGTALTVSVQNAPEDMECTYRWSVGGSTLSGVTGNTYTPTENDLEKFIKVVVTATNYDASWEVSTYMSELPVIYIDTEDNQDVIVKDTYKDANMRIQGSDNFQKDSVLYDGLTEIKGRGNSTWDYAAANGLKKPYKLKLDKKTDVLGMGKSKHWVLLANVIDHTNMRNELVYQFAADIGMECYLDAEPCVLILNGEYRGFYQIAEHKRVDEGRIEVFDWCALGEDIAAAIADAEGFSKNDTSALEEQVGELDLSWVDTGNVVYKGKTYKVSDYYTEEIPEFTGGFVFDMDFRLGQSKFISKFYTDYGYPMFFEAPEYAKTSTTMMDYAKTYLQAFENALHDDDFYAEYDGEEVHYSELYDVKSLLQNWFVVEYTMNWDAMKNSTLMYKDLDDVMKMGPVWDFDWCWGNINMYSNSAVWVVEGWHTTQDSFCEQAYQRQNWNRYLISDPYFAMLAYEEWDSVRAVIEDMIKDGGRIDQLTEQYRAASVANDEKWSSTYNRYSGYGVTNGQVVYKQGETFDDAINTMKYFIENRVAWLDKQFTSVENLLSSWGRYKGSNALTVSDIQTLESGETSITASVTNNNIKKIAFYVNGIRAGEADVTNGKAVLAVDDTAFRNGENVNNMVQIRAMDASGKFLTSGSSVMTNYKMFQKTTETVTKLTGKVSVEGDAVVGSELKAVVTDTNNTGTLSYQWYADGNAIEGAVEETYVLTDGDAGKKISVAVGSSVEDGTIVSAETAAVEEKEPDVPPVTKDALKQAIENTAKLEADDYTADSWEVFQEALNKAKEILGKEDATQEEVDNAKTTLEEAQNGLKEKPDVPLVTKDALKQAIENTAKLEADDYTADSWEAFQEALNKAQVIMDKEDATQEEVDSAKTALEEAQNGLKEKPVTPPDDPVITVDKTKLEAVIQEAEKLKESDYTEASWQVFQEALQDAKSVNEEKEPKQEDVDRAAKELTEAMEALVPVGKLPYIDVADTDWFYKEVAYNYYAGTMTGIDGTHFDPYTTLVRAQFATILHRIEGTPKVTYTNRFPDVPDEQFYSDAVLWAAEAKVVTGYTDSGYFGTNDPITREQMVVMMYRYADYKGYDTSKTAEISRFTDAGTVSEFAEEAMKWAVENEIISGKKNDNGSYRLDPQGSTSRAECAIIIQRFMEKFEK
ncbi:CotH kinase family protein [Dorea acetigenes]|uniref:CotH kinase family protein n=1 Tax=Dorea acetigenes TaxID=2981787 RepID=A0ABT2RLZ2_9FIRM|nr:CotH kinase family protein [Dorea acetigenes]MCU6686424.1 CotH kinase family protein [Dorea acetigenes]SCI94166.1 Endoglucanase precursor [uncultured Clostridium sp.]